MQNIKIVRGLNIKALNNRESLLRAFIDDFLSGDSGDLFTPATIIVPNLSMANWLKDQLAIEFGVMANINFRLINQFIENIYSDATGHELFELSTLKFKIYDYLINLDKSCKIYSQLVEIICNKDGEKDFYRCYQFAFELERIFIDYMRYRAHEILYLDFKDKLDDLQRELFDYILGCAFQENKKTPLDVYEFFVTNPQGIRLNLARNIYLFGVFDVSCANLEVLKRISEDIMINWYQVMPSLEYYYDLLDNKTVAKLKRKILKEPEIKVEELYLIDGNPLIANLGIKSREFTEVLLAQDFNFIDLEPVSFLPNSLLDLVKDDVYRLVSRIDKNKRLTDSLDCYQDPLGQGFENDDSIKINICHNRLREVQVLFSTVSSILADNPEIKLNEIIILAPNIGDYENYIDAVFMNEYVGEAKLKIPYYICGRESAFKEELLITLMNCLDIDYRVTVNKVFGILNQSRIMANLGLEPKDLDTIFYWLRDNNVHFGLNDWDYKEYGDNIEGVFSFKHLVNNLVLGVAFLEDQQQDEFNGRYYYDNLEFAQLQLFEKLSQVLIFLEKVRELFYVDEFTFRNIYLSDVINLLNDFLGIITDSDDAFVIECLIGYLKSLGCVSEINLPIFIDILNSYVGKGGDYYIETGKLTFASLGVARYIPFKVVYILGMNDGEYPRFIEKNRLNVLRENIAFADMNSIFEDKQVLLDTILASQEKLYFSYIGRRDTDNRELKPAISLGLFIDVLRNSLGDDSLLKQNLIVEHSLHPFIESNHNNGYDGFWSDIKTSTKYTNLHWDFVNFKGLDKAIDNLALTSITIEDLVSFYSYTNRNLYNTLEITEYKKMQELSDTEEFNLFSKDLLKNFYRELEVLLYRRFDANFECLKDNQDTLYSYLYQKGSLAIGEISKLQFERIFAEYVRYKQVEGVKKCNLTYVDDELGLRVDYQLGLNEDNQVVILNNFAYFIDSSLNHRSLELGYFLKIKGLIYLLLINNTEINSMNLGQIDTSQVLLKYGFEADCTGWMKLKEGVDAGGLLRDVLEFYIYGQTHPVLINDKLIDDYSKKDLPIVELLTEPIVSKINQDRVFYNNYQAYFENHVKSGEKNSINVIASFLSFAEVLKNID